MLGSGGGNKKIFKHISYKKFYIAEMGETNSVLSSLSDTTYVDVILNISWGAFLLFFKGNCFHISNILPLRI